MKAREFKPRRLDVRAFIESGETLGGDEPLAGFERLVEPIGVQAGECEHRGPRRGQQIPLLGRQLTEGPADRHELGRLRIGERQLGLHPLHEPARVGVLGGDEDGPDVDGRPVEHPGDLVAVVVQRRSGGFHLVHAS